MIKYRVGVIVVALLFMLMSVISGFASEVDPTEEWICSSCGTTTSGNFCHNCGAQRNSWICPNCGFNATNNFCNNCGTAKPDSTSTVQPVVEEPKPTAELTLFIPTDTEPTVLSSGTYIVGKDIPAGCYLAQKLDGDRYTPVCYLFAADDTEQENNLFSGSADENGAVGVLEDGQIFKVTWTSVRMTSFAFNDSSFDVGETLLPSGRYIVGVNIPEGTYLFKRIDGDRYTPVCYVFNSDDKDHDSNLFNGSVDENGAAAVLEKGQEFIVTWTSARAQKYAYDASSNDTILPSGRYIVGKNIQPGTYHISKIPGDRYTPVCYLFNPGDTDHDNNLFNGSFYGDGTDITLSDGQEFIITWTSVNISSNGKTSSTTSRTTVTEAPTEAPTEKPTERPTEAPTKTPTSSSENDFKEQLNYLFSPLGNVSVTSIIPMGDDTFTAMLSNGKSYMGYTLASDGSYSIQVTNLSSSNYDSIDNPYDYTDERFRSLLNYLMRNDGRTVTSIIPMFGDIYTAQDSDGNSYMISILCSESTIMVGMLGT